MQGLPGYVTAHTAREQTPPYLVEAKSETIVLQPT
jgi:hypothetical protein